MLTLTHTREKAKYDEGPTGDILRGLGGSGFTLFRKWKHERAQWAEMDDDQKVKALPGRRVAAAVARPHPTSSPTPLPRPSHSAPSLIYWPRPRRVACALNFAGSSVQPVRTPTRTNLRLRRRRKRRYAPFARPQTPKRRP